MRKVHSFVDFTHSKIIPVNNLLISFFASEFFHKLAFKFKSIFYRKLIPQTEFKIFQKLKAIILFLKI